MPSESPFKMRLTLNVLNHLGLNLYSNVPAVLMFKPLVGHQADPARA